MEKLDAVGVVEGSRNLLDPRLDFIRLECAFFRKEGCQRLPFEAIHRNCRQSAVFDEIINPEDVRVDQLPIALHFLPQLGHPAFIAHNGWRDEVQRNFFS